MFFIYNLSVLNLMPSLKSIDKLDEHDELKKNYIDERYQPIYLNNSSHSCFSHIQAFRLALSQVDSIDEDRRISALSDFAPVHERVKK